MPFRHFFNNHWVELNAPMFSGFRDRIEILSRGELPPDQTVEGFFAGESVPVNQKLSDMFLQLHISERTGRGVPKIVEYCGRDNISLNEKSICVTVPYDRIGESYASYAPVDVQVEVKNAQVDGENAYDEGTYVPDKGENVPVDAPVNEENAPVDIQVSNKEKIILFCRTPRGIWEIADMLGYKDKRTVRKLLNSLMTEGKVMMTVPDKPHSKNQKYITVI